MEGCLVEWAFQFQHRGQRLFNGRRDESDKASVRIKMTVTDFPCSIMSTLYKRLRVIFNLTATVTSALCLYTVWISMKKKTLSSWGGLVSRRWTGSLSWTPSPSQVPSKWALGMDVIPYRTLGFTQKELLWTKLLPATICSIISASEEGILNIYWHIIKLDSFRSLWQCKKKPGETFLEDKHESEVSNCVKLSFRHGWKSPVSIKWLELWQKTVLTNNLWLLLQVQ